jgi:hypothetical protein
MKEWQAAPAREAFAELIDAAVNGTPQLVRRQDGKAVVVVSKAHVDSHEPNLRDYLLTAGYAGAHDAFNDALEKVKQGSARFPAPAAPPYEP